MSARVCGTAGSTGLVISRRCAAAAGELTYPQDLLQKQIQGWVQEHLLAGCFLLLRSAGGHRCVKHRSLARWATTNRFKGLRGLFCVARMYLRLVGCVGHKEIALRPGRNRREISVRPP